MKKIKTLSAAIVLLIGFVSKVDAQYYFYDNNYYDNPLTFELGSSLGVMNCLTDVGGGKGIGKKFIKDLNLSQTQPAASIYFGLNYKYAFCLRAEGTIGQVSGSDALLKNVSATTYGRYERNLSFRTSISEFMLSMEIHPLFIFKNYDDENSANLPMFSPYLLAGIGFYHFNPQAKLNGNWIDLQPLSTEGEGFAQYPNRKPYSLNQVNIPLGAGLRYELNSSFNLKAEFVYRILFTDYLDDVSTTYIDPTLYYKYFTGAKLVNALLLNNRKRELNPAAITQPGDTRGNPKNNDSYFSFNFKIGYILGRERRK